jgi:hypothetical protein
MSQKGIKEVAEIFSKMQETRIKLLGGDKQDMWLGQLLETGKDAMKTRFCEITTEGGD